MWRGVVRMTDRESPIQKACHGLLLRESPPDKPIKGLLYHSIVNETPHVGNPKDPRQKKRAAILGAKLNALGRRAGVADYLIMWQGQAVYIEFKCPKDVHGPKTYQNKEQKRFETDAIQAGAHYHVVRSVTEFIGVLRAYNIPIGARA